MKRKGSPGRPALFVILLLSVFSWHCTKGYRADSLGVTDEVRRFVADHRIAGSDIEIVRSIIEVTHDPFLFIKTDRPMLKTWIRDPGLVASFQTAVSEKQKRLADLGNRMPETVLSAEEAQERRDLLRDIFFGTHNLFVYNNLIKHKKMMPEDTAFVVSGDEAIRFRIRDGCTTMAHVFIALAKAAGLKDVRFVVGANLSEFIKACPLRNQKRVMDVEIDGHMIALAKIDGRWALVNCTYFEPYAVDPDVRYEILTTFEGEEIQPEGLRGRILRLPSFQREGFPPSELLIAGVGSNPDDDLEVENHAALMNLSVSGDPRDPVCRWTIPSTGKD